MQSGGEFLEKVRELARRDGRYHYQAYLFVFQALEYTLRRLDERRHVSGRELLDGIRDFARLNFGAMARTVFESWGVNESLDFGRIVFSLVENDLMSKTEGDTVEEFADGLDFEQAFETDYVPADMVGEEEGESDEEG